MNIGKKRERFVDIGINKRSNEECIENFVTAFFVYLKGTNIFEGRKKVCGRKCFLKVKFLFFE